MGAVVDPVQAELLNLGVMLMSSGPASVKLEPCWDMGPGIWAILCLWAITAAGSMNLHTDLPSLTTHPCCRMVVSVIR